MAEMQEIIDCPEDLIRLVPLFAELPNDEAEMLWTSGERHFAGTGDTVIREGEMGDSLYIVLSGKLEVTRADNDREIALATFGSGDFFGEMSLLEAAPRTASVRAVEPSELLVVGPQTFRKLLETRPATAARVLRTVASRLRSTESSLVQSEKLASLGTLAAGLAHELNNPAAAIQSSVAYLRQAFEEAHKAYGRLCALDLGPAGRASLAKLEATIAESAGAVFDDAAARRDESDVAGWLEGAGSENAWEAAPAFAGFGWTLAALENLQADFGGDAIGPVLGWLGAVLVARQLTAEIEIGSRAISRIVGAVKSYAYLDQAPVQDVDIAASLSDTLTILKHKLKQGVEVVLDIAPDLPRIEAYGGELNQVWTNLVDNAVQAMDGKGVLTVTARRLGDEVAVCIADTGPGIPPDIVASIFEPFFTTKAQGVGTGLGLHVAHNIIVGHHRGRIDVDSRPGRTEFRVVLPIRF